MRLYTVQSKQIFSRLMLDGLKLSERPSFAETAPWDGKSSVLRCTADFPRDYDKEKETVIRLEADSEAVTVMEGAFEGLEEGGEEILFLCSAVPAVEYRLGKYIKPLYFVAADIGVDNIAPQESEEGNIRFFDSAERYYIECVAALFEDKFDEFKLFSVRGLLESLAAAGRMTRTENGDYLIFTDKEGNVYPVCKHFHG